MLYWFFHQRNEPVVGDVAHGTLPMVVLVLHIASKCDKTGTLNLEVSLEEVMNGVVESFPAADELVIVGVEVKMELR